LTSSSPEVRPGWPLRTLYAYLTEGCNLACRHCWLAPRLDSSGGERPVLDPRLLAEVLRQGRELGLESVKLTGGEPFLHPEILRILDLVRAQGLQLALETNGTRVTPELAAAVASCRKPFASVSLDGADAASHEYVRGVPGCFEKARQGLRMLGAAGVRTQVILTVMRHNAGQLEAVVRMAEDLGAGSVKFNVVQPAERGEALHRTGEALSVRELVELGHRVEHELSTRTALRLHFSYPMAFRSLRHMFHPDDGIGCSTCGIFRILGLLADGSYALCGVGSTVPELLFGHAATDPLARVWLETPVLKQIRDGLPDRLEGVCGRCLMRRRCRGACLAQNYYSTRSLWAPYWFCQAAEEEGIFPASRLAEAAPAAN
jgi:SynChlorMet cassette radical SAM/SPASM protein ScmF